VEYLWVPGAYLQLSGPPELELSEGRLVTVLPVRINASSKTLTVEVHALARPSRRLIIMQAQSGCAPNAAGG
jgi:hypothetical protein